MNVYITFGGAFYDETTRRILASAHRCGADEVLVYDDEWLTRQPFYTMNRWLWDHPHQRGFGWYAWKPFVIWDALSRVRAGDVVLYTDADTYPIADLSPLFETCARDGIMIFASEGHTQRAWCKRDCFVVMGQADPQFLDVPAGVARFMLFKAGHWTATQFLMEWITYCVNPRANTFDASVTAPEHPGFLEHRAEQAIMTNLAHKYGIRLHREADQHGEGSSADRRLYAQLFMHDNADDTPRVTRTDLRGSRFANVELFCA